jgi:hypothetical protein
MTVDNGGRAMAIALDRPEVTLVAHLKQTLPQGAQTGSQYRRAPEYHRGI